MLLLHDLDHTLGFDISLDITGDLQTVSYRERSQQRLLRRLLTNPGDYLFHLDYGAGLPSHVGARVDRHKIQAWIRGQLAQEASVATQPAPEIDVTPIREGVSVRLCYGEVDARQPVALFFEVNR